MGIPLSLNRYKRAGVKPEDKDKANGHVPEEEEGEMGGGAGLTLIKIRLFKEVKKDEASYGKLPKKSTTTTG